jgi:hypothetical protein
MNDCERLLAIEQIKALKARYFNALDAKDWDAFGDVFAEDAYMDLARDVAVVVGPAPARAASAARPPGISGREQIVARVSSSVNDVPTVHQGHMPIIEVTGDDTATGVWQLADLLDFPGVTLHGRGLYHETYRCEDGVWRIASLALRYLRHEWVSTEAGS